MDREKKKELIQRTIMENAFALCAQRGIESISLGEIAAASDIGRATLFRYFGSKLELVVAVSVWKWQEYVDFYRGSFSEKRIAQMTGVEYLRMYLDSFIDLYRNHPDILRFNYSFNNYIRTEKNAEKEIGSYVQTVKGIETKFFELYARGMKDRTLNPAFTREAMFSGSFHIMLAAATRFAVGLLYISKDASEPEQELVMLEQMLLHTYSTQT